MQRMNFPDFLQIKDWYLAGWSARAIVAELNQRGIPSPKGGRWFPQSVKNLLASPFYFGMVYFGVTKYQRDRRTGREIITKNPNPSYNVGGHKPLWDEATHQRILTIMESRGQGYRGKKTRRLTSLLRCGLCGKTLHSDKSRDRPGQPVFWRCSAKQRGHTFIMDHTAMDLILPMMVAAIRNLDGLTVDSPHQDDPITRKQSELDELQRRKKRWLDLYEQETIDPATLAARIGELETRINAISGELVKLNAMHQSQKTASDTLIQLQEIIEAFPDYCRNAPAEQVNTDLRSIIHHITVTKDHQITIHWRNE